MADANKQGASVTPLTPKPDPNEEEMGIGTVFPGSTWDTFSFNQNKSLNRDGKFVVAISNAADAVPLDKLVEMRRRDGQTRMLLRMIILPIMSCLKDAEWIEPEEHGPEGKAGPETTTKKTAKGTDSGPGVNPQTLQHVTLAAGDPDSGDSDEQADVEPELEPSSEKQTGKETQFANDMFRLPPTAGGMTTPLSRVVKETLLAVLEGYSAFEEVRHVPDRGPLKGKITLRKLAHRDSRTLKFLVDTNGGFAGLRQLALRPNGETVDVAIPADKCWYWAAHEEENPFYGISMFESAWYHYDIKTKTYYIAHLAAQFAAVPGRVGEVPPGASGPAKAAFRAALKNFAFNTAMTHPTGYKVTPFNGNSAFDFVKLIDHHSHLQAKSLLQGFADTENRTVLIDNGKADASADMFVQSLTAIMDEIAESWSTHLMPKYIDWNFGTGVYPKFRFGQLSDDGKDAVKELFQTMVVSSVLNSTPEFVREMEKKLTARLDLDIDYDEIERHEAKAAEVQAQQAEAEAEAASKQQDALDSAAVTAAANPPAPALPKIPKPGGGLVAASAHDIDDLVSMAQELFEMRPLEDPVDYEDL